MKTVLGYDMSSINWPPAVTLRSSAKKDCQSLTRLGLTQKARVVASLHALPGEGLSLYLCSHIPNKIKQEWGITPKRWPEPG